MVAGYDEPTIVTNVYLAASDFGSVTWESPGAYPWPDTTSGSRSPDGTAEVSYTGSRLTVTELPSGASKSYDFGSGWTALDPITVDGAVWSPDSTHIAVTVGTPQYWYDRSDNPRLSRYVDSIEVVDRNLTSFVQVPTRMTFWPQYYVHCDDDWDTINGWYTGSDYNPVWEPCTIYGSEGVDNITGTAGNDVICGLGGNDTIHGGGGNDILYGGEGNDRLYGGGGTNKLFGEGGDDQLVGEGDANTVDGGPGDDVLSGPIGPDVLIGGDGKDTAYYGTRTQPVTVRIGDGANDGQAGENDDVRSDVENVTGGSGNDYIDGSAAINTLRGQGGDDQLFGLQGNDTLDGGPGADAMAGGIGVDTVTYNARTASQPVSAVIDGTRRSGGDLDGPPGARDSIATNIENLTGGSGDDTLTGNAAANTLTGGLGRDTLLGGGGNDNLRARDGIADAALNCDGGSGAPGPKDHADVDVIDPPALGCEQLTHP
jgi:Ca2+-binding RTX toxin-like protein